MTLATTARDWPAAAAIPAAAVPAAGSPPDGGGFGHAVVAAMATAGPARGAPAPAPRAVPLAAQTVDVHGMVASQISASTTPAAPSLRSRLAIAAAPADAGAQSVTLVAAASIGDAGVTAPTPTASGSPLLGPSHQRPAPLAAAEPADPIDTAPHVVVAIVQTPILPTVPVGSSLAPRKSAAKQDGPPVPDATGLDPPAIAPLPTGLVPAPMVAVMASVPAPAGSAPAAVTAAVAAPALDAANPPGPLDASLAAGRAAPRTDPPSIATPEPPPPGATAPPNPVQVRARSVPVSAPRGSPAGVKSSDLTPSIATVGPAAPAPPALAPAAAMADRAAAISGPAPAAVPTTSPAGTGEASTTAAVAMTPPGPLAAGPAQAAAAPAVAAPAAVVVATAPSHLAHDVGLAIARQVAADGNQLHISLDPPQFGRIDVTMAFDDRGTLRAVVAADSAVSLDLLRRDSGDLGRAMSDAGVRADTQSFRFEGRGDGRGGDQPRQPPRPTGAEPEPLSVSEIPDAGRFRSLRWRGQLDVLA